METTAQSAMQSTMQAAVMEGFGPDLHIEDRPVPQPGPGEVLLRIESCGVCHSDLHIAEGDQPGFKAITKQRLIPGHEVVGRVAAAGAGVEQLKPGDRVGVAWLYWSCGECTQCKEGLENLCRRQQVTGLMVDGGYAQFMLAKASHAIPIPANLSSEEAAPLFCAGVTVYRALQNAGTGAGQRVAVFGVGGLGHLAVQIAHALGAEVVAFDVSDAKLELARTLGASRTVNVLEPQAVKAFGKETGGAHVAVVTSAAKQAYDTALRCLRPAGTLAVVGLPSEPLAFSALQLVGGEYRVVGSAVGTRDDLRAVLALAAEGKLRCRTEGARLASINKVFERMRKGEITGRVVLDLTS